MKDHSTNIVITGGQVRMARAYLKWTAGELAEKAGVALSTVKRIESVDGIPNTRINNLIAVRDTIIATGRIAFDGENCICIEVGSGVADPASASE